jgi:hypothetical protein
MDYNPDRNKHEVTSKTFVQDWDGHKPTKDYWIRQNQRYQAPARNKTLRVLVMGTLRRPAERPVRVTMTSVIWKGRSGSD